ncbi:glutaredoxin family protein [Desulfobacca acetoxidans]
MLNLGRVKRLFMVPLLLLLIAPIPALSTEKTVRLYFFRSSGCPHCDREKVFLHRLEKKYPHLKINSIDITESRANLELLRRVAKHFNTGLGGVPATVVGGEYIQGWQGEATTGAILEAAVQKALDQEITNPLEGFIPSSPVPVEVAAPAPKTLPGTITVPLWGEVQIRQLSLGFLTILFGALDGFNPCAMWVLVLLLGLLLGMENVHRRWILGTAFIAASALVYFLIMCAWLNLFLFLGLVLWVRIIIALVALGVGYYNLRDYFTNRAGTCKVTGGPRRQRLTDRIHEVTRKQNLWLALGGMILLAFAANVIELLCSAGLPVVYLQILSFNALPVWQYYLYIILYILIFMLDDLLVFFGAMITLQITGLSTRYKRWSNLVGSLIMIAIGILLLVKPEALMFG